MPDLGEETLQIAYKGAEITASTLEKLFAAILQEIEKNRAQEKGKPKARDKRSIAQEKNISLGEQVNTLDIKRAASQLKSEGVLFQVLKRPDKAMEYTLLIKGKDMAAIEKALKSFTDEVTQERTPDRSGYGFHEYELAAAAREKAALLDNGGEPNLFDRLHPPGKDRGNTRIFTGKSLQEDLQKSQKAVALRNAERSNTRTSKIPAKGIDR